MLTKNLRESLFAFSDDCFGHLEWKDNEQMQWYGLLYVPYKLDSVIPV